MSLFRRKSDPLQERARDLTEQINALEAEIRRLHQRIEHNAAPGGAARRGNHFARPAELVLEDVPSPALSPPAQEPARDLRNELGVRRLDLAGGWQRLARYWRGPTTSNPRLVSYLAAGSIQGLRPLRYERRIARNRFIVAFLLLFACLWGLLAIILRQY
jgi:hypothetical protein